MNRSRSKEDQSEPELQNFMQNNIKHSKIESLNQKKSENHKHLGVSKQFANVMNEFSPTNKHLIVNFWDDPKEFLSKKYYEMYFADKDRRDDLAAKVIVQKINKEQDKNFENCKQTVLENKKQSSALFDKRRIERLCLTKKSNQQIVEKLNPDNKDIIKKLDNLTYEEQVKNAISRSSLEKNNKIFRYNNIDNSWNDHAKLPVKAQKKVYTEYAIKQEEKGIKNISNRISKDIRDNFNKVQEQKRRATDNYAIARYKRMMFNDHCDNFHHLKGKCKFHSNSVSLDQNNSLLSRDNAIMSIATKNTPMEINDYSCLTNPNVFVNNSCSHSRQNSVEINNIASDCTITQPKVKSHKRLFDISANKILIDNFHTKNPAIGELCSLNNVGWNTKESNLNDSKDKIYGSNTSRRNVSFATEFGNPEEMLQVKSHGLKKKINFNLKNQIVNYREILKKKNLSQTTSKKELFLEKEPIRAINRSSLESQEFINTKITPWVANLYDNSRPSTPVGAKNLHSVQNSPHRRLRSHLKSDSLIFGNSDFQGMILSKVDKKFAYVKDNNLINQLTEKSNFVKNRKEKIISVEKQILDLKNTKLTSANNSQIFEHTETSKNETLNPILNYNSFIEKKDQHLNQIVIKINKKSSKNATNKFFGKNDRQGADNLYDDIEKFEKLLGHGKSKATLYPAIKFRDTLFKS